MNLLIFLYKRLNEYIIWFLACSKCKSLKLSMFGNIIISLFSEWKYIINFSIECIKASSRKVIDILFSWKRSCTFRSCICTSCKNNSCICCSRTYIHRYLIEEYKTQSEVFWWNNQSEIYHKYYYTREYSFHNRLFIPEKEIFDKLHKVKVREEINTTIWIFTFLLYFVANQ